MKRYVEVDLLRGMAVILMVFYHFLFDLKYFSLNHNFTRDFTDLFWSTFAGFIGVLFLITAGMSAQIPTQKKSQTSKQKIKAHGLNILGIGISITVVSLFVIPHIPIYFGILHCIGISLLLYSFSFKFKNADILIFILLVGIGNVLPHFVKVSTPWFLIFNLKPSIYPMGDYFPLFPWGGAFFLGSLIMRVLLKDGDLLKLTHTPKVLKPIVYLGNHSLIIYLLHQPLLLFFLTMLGIAKVF